MHFCWNMYKKVRGGNVFFTKICRVTLIVLNFFLSFKILRERWRMWGSWKVMCSSWRWRRTIHVPVDRVSPFLPRKRRRLLTSCKVPAAGAPHRVATENWERRAESVQGTAEPLPDVLGHGISCFAQYALRRVPLYLLKLISISDCWWFHHVFILHWITIDWLIDWLIDWIDWLIDWLIDWDLDWIGLDFSID